MLHCMVWVGLLMSGVLWWTLVYFCVLLCALMYYCVLFCALVRGVPLQYRVECKLWQQMVTPWPGIIGKYSKHSEWNNIIQTLAPHLEHRGCKSQPWDVSDQADVVELFVELYGKQSMEMMVALAMVMMPTMMTMTVTMMMTTTMMIVKWTQLSGSSPHRERSQPSNLCPLSPFSILQPVREHLL